MVKHRQNIPRFVPLVRSETKRIVHINPERVLYVEERVTIPSGEPYCTVVFGPAEPGTRSPWAIDVSMTAGDVVALLKGPDDGDEE